MAQVATIPSINLVESAACTPPFTTWPTWSLAGPGTVTFTRVEGPNIEFDFSFPMAAKAGGEAKGTFTFAGKVKSPCYFIE